MRGEPHTWQEQLAQPSRKSVGKGDSGLTASFQVSAIYSSHNVPEIWDNPYWFYSFYSAWKTIFLVYEQLNYVTFIRKL